jgi:hypothetical protein
MNDYYIVAFSLTYELHVSLFSNLERFFAFVSKLRPKYVMADGRYLSKRMPPLSISLPSFHLIAVAGITLIRIRTALVAD